MNMYRMWRNFFRYNVKKSNDIVTVREELELVDHYIYILNVRFSGDIHYGKEIEEDLLDSCMPSMILQPIVENSVNHGIREMNGEGKIRLKVYLWMEIRWGSVSGITASEHHRCTATYV